MMNNFNLPTESSSGTFAPEHPVLQEVTISSTHAEQAKDENLDLLARVICDRISPDLSLNLERHVRHNLRSIFSRPIGATDTQKSIQMNPVPSLSVKVEPDAVEQLTRAIEHLLRQRFILAQERQGQSKGCISW
jgi:hypothetical protein